MSGADGQSDHGSDEGRCNAKALGGRPAQWPRGSNKYGGRRAFHRGSSRCMQLGCHGQRSAPRRTSRRPLRHKTASASSTASRTLPESPATSQCSSTMCSHRSPVSRIGTPILVVDIKFIASPPPQSQSPPPSGRRVDTTCTASAPCMPSPFKYSARLNTSSFTGSRSGARGSLLSSLLRRRAQSARPTMSLTRSAGAAHGNSVASTVVDSQVTSQQMLPGILAAPDHRQRLHRSEQRKPRLIDPTDDPCPRIPSGEMIHQIHRLAASPDFRPACHRNSPGFLCRRTWQRSMT